MESDPVFSHVEQLREFGDTQDVNVWRNLVIASVDQVLSDLNKVADPERQDHLQTSLDFILNASVQFPELFLPTDVQTSVAANQSFENGLTSWVIRHLLRVIAIFPSNVHLVDAKTKAESVLLAIACMAKTNNILYFCSLVKEFIKCLEDLCDIYKNFFDDNQIDYSSQLNRFGQWAESLPINPNDKSLTNRSLNINEPESCQQLQITITKLLSELIIHIGLYNVSVSDLWATVVVQLEYGEVELKTVSIILAEKLLKLIVPEPCLLMYYGECLLSLTEMLSSGFSDCDGDYISLESALTRSSNGLIDRLDKGDLLPIDRLSVLQMVSKKFMNLILSYGTRSLRTSVLRQSIFRNLAHSLHGQPCELVSFSIMAESYRGICQQLLDELFVESDSLQHASVVIREIIRLEFVELKSTGVLKSNASKVTEKISLEADVDYDERLKDLETQMVCKSTVVAMLSMNLDRLLTKMNDASPTEIVHYLNVERCVLDALVFSGARLRCMKVINVRSSTLKPERIAALLSNWISLLTRLVSTNEFLESAVVSYGVIVESCRALMLVESLDKISLDHFATIVGLLSVPWLSSETSWLDLKLTNSKVFADLSDRLSDMIGYGTLDNCIHLLSTITRPHVAPQWRMQAIKKALCDGRPEVKSVVVRNVVYLVHCFHSTNRQLVLDILVDAVRDSSPLVELALAEVLSPLACSVSGSSSLVINVSMEIDEHVSDWTVYAHCSICKNSKTNPADAHLPLSQNSKTSPWSGSDISAVFHPLAKLFHSQNPKVKHTVICGLESLFRHLWTWSNTDVNYALVPDLLSASLSLLEDPDYDIRFAFSKSVKHLVALGNDIEATDQINKIIVNKLNEYEKTCGGLPISTMETVLYSVSQIGRVADRDLLLICMSVILNAYIFPISKFLEAVAEQQLKQLSFERKVSMRHLFTQFGQQISKAIAGCLYETKLTKPNWDISELLQKVADVFLYEDVNSFLKRTENLLLPHVIKRADATASALLKSISRLMDDPNHKNVIMRTVSYIFCHVVISTENSEQLAKVLTYLESETDWSLADLLRCGSHIDSLLLIHLGTCYDQVLNGIRIWLKAKGSFDNLGVGLQLCSNEQLADLLQPNLLGILVHFDKHISDVTVSMADKMKAYKSLVLLMELMGSQHVTRVRMRIMTTLKIGLQFKDRAFAKLCCQAWSCFVHIVDLTSLGPMLSQLVVGLLPLLQQLPALVAQIFHFLIVENRERLHQHLHELYFMPEIPELTQVNTTLKQYLDGQYSCKDLRKQIEQLLKGIGHEAVDVRQMALVKLRQSLRTNKDVLRSLILANETADPIITQIVAALLQGCRESDTTTRNLVGQCLGELGAVDPGRLELLTANRPKEEQTRFVTSMAEDCFAYELINELAKAFLRAEDNVQDCVAFAIQELLQIYDIQIEQRNDQTAKSSSSSSSKKWRQFSDDVLEILYPLTHSRYVLNAVCNWTGLQKPIYASKKAKTFELWVCTLTSYLGSMLDNEKCRRVSNACLGVTRQDSQVALFLLPIFSVQLLVENNPEHINMLLQEMLTVLHDCKDTHNRRCHIQQQQQQHNQLEFKRKSTHDIRHMSAQTVFSLLDHMTKWVRHHILLSLNKTSTSMSGSSSLKPPVFEPNIQRLKSFLAKVPQDVLALASFNCGAYSRSLLHHEQYIRATGKSLDQASESLDFLLRLYVALDEPDGVAGLMAIQPSHKTSLTQQILAFESVGHLSDASVCYDRAIQMEPENISLRQGLLKNRLALGELNSALNLANGMITDNPNWSSQLNMFRAEAAWKLGQWDKLHVYLKSEEHASNWNVGLGKLLLSVKSKDEKNFYGNLSQLRLGLISPLSAASMEMGSYYRGYENIVRLQMLNELEQGVVAIFRSASWQLPSSQETSSSELPDVDLNILAQQWQTRLKIIQASYRTQAPVLDLHRIILQLAKEENKFDVDCSIGHCWLLSASIARECGLIQTAHSSLLSAGEYNAAEFCLEKANWLWEKGDCEQARICIDKALTVLYPDRTKFKATSVRDCKSSERVDLAKMLLQLARYSDETSSCESNAILKLFKEVTYINNDWEDGYFYTAKYYDKILTVLIDSDKPEKKGGFIVQIVQNFSHSLQYGNQYIYQSLPRMLTLWLDFGSEVVETADKQVKDYLQQLNKWMCFCCNKLSAYQFLVAFPQLISRICHAQTDVFNQLKEIIAKVLVEFPQQAMWMMMAVSKSSYQMRVKRCQDIFNRAKTLRPDLNKFLQDATKLTDRLLDLSNRPVEGNLTTLTISQHFKPLLRLLDDKDFSPILLPLQSQMMPILPNMYIAPSSHVPFQGGQVFIRGIEDTVEVLASLQKPKKITLKGSDGRSYIMLCKPKDDLRKDARLMEFTSIVNRCLKKDADSRRRNLHIRTFTVTPLNEECGMLEWVPNTFGLRPILLKLYKERGLYMSGKELRSLQTMPRESLEKKLQIHRTKLLPSHPAIFSEWFLKTFPDPTTWYNARLAYCRTTAVMSMVGYILGLGDRHGENILLDSTIGDCVHVDFNCLFNKGETFDYPEIVPFRLTHNMVEAMGPLGFEGIFRKSSEVTLRAMRDQMDPLMSVLKTFIYDPLVEWSKPVKGRSNPTETGEIRNEQAQTHVNNIEDRLRGVCKVTTKSKSVGLPLSVEGQVSHLIKEATEESNLCQMYIGWAAYM